MISFYKMVLSKRNSKRKKYFIFLKSFTLELKDRLYCIEKYWGLNPFLSKLWISSMKNLRACPTIV